MRKLNRTMGSLFLAASVSCTALTGCGDNAVYPSVNLVDRSRQELGIGSFSAINGTYGAACTQRAGAWSVGIGGFASLDHPPLTVLKNDALCVLSLTDTGVVVGLRAGDALTLLGAIVGVGGDVKRNVVRHALRQVAEDAAAESFAAHVDAAIKLHRALHVHRHDAAGPAIPGRRGNGAGLLDHKRT